MFQFKMNEAARATFRKLPRWKLAIIGVLGVALGVMFAVLAAGVLLMLIPVILIGGIAARFLLSPRQPSKPARASTGPGPVIDADYKIVDSTDKAANSDRP